MKKDLITIEAYHPKLGKHIKMEGCRSIKEVAKLNPSLKNFREVEFTRK